MHFELLGQVCFNTFVYLFQLLLRKKAAEELKKEQERKAAERRKVIDERCGQPKSTGGLSEGKLLYFRDCGFRVTLKIKDPEFH